MRIALICAAGILGSTIASAQHSLLTTTKTLGQVAPRATLGAATAPAGSFLGGGGNCASPTVIPPGPTTVNFPFDNTAAASMGVATNPFEVICTHTGQTGIDNEEWWSWTATADGVARLSTCTNLVGVDTKVAIYEDNCPQMATLDPISCKDDDPNCPNFETVVHWDITSGTNYLIQLGTFLAQPGGVGDFSIQQLPSRPAGQYDLGTTQNAFGPGANGGDIIWMQVYDAGVGEILNSVDVAFGTSIAPTLVDPNGSQATIAVYAGDPIRGLTVLATQNVLTAQSGTDTTVNYPLTTPIAVSDTYTIGVLVNASPSVFPAPADHSVNSRGRAWLGFDDTGVTPIDINDPFTAPQGPVEMQVGFNPPFASDCVWMLRVHTTPNAPTFNELCFGDGGNQMGCTNCPCTNNSAANSGTGCVNSSGVGSRLIASGDPSVTLPSGSTTDLRFAASGLPANAFSILNSGDSVAPGNMANPCFGLNTGGQAVAFDGLRCAITNTRRHGGRSADVNGSIGVTNNPWGGEGGPPVGLAQAGVGFSSGQTRFFQIINRDDPLTICMRGLNTSQAVEVQFAP